MPSAICGVAASLVPANTFMSIQPSKLYCSKACEDAVMVRSHGECPECHKRWDGKSAGDERHYRNNAWKLCDTCASQQRRCVVCAGSIDQGRKTSTA